MAGALPVALVTFKKDFRKNTTFFCFIFHVIFYFKDNRKLIFLHPHYYTLM